MDAYIVSLLKAWWGDAATRRERLLLRPPAADHRRPLALPRRCCDMLDGTVTGLLRHRARTRRSARRTARCSGWRWPSSTGSSSATSPRSRPRPFWYDSPEIESGELRTEEIGTEVFFLPAAAHTEKDGSFTNTQRLLQWHHKARRAAGRLPLRAVVLLPPRPDASASKLAGSTDPRDRPLLDLTWDYPTRRQDRGARRRGGAARDQRLRTRDGSALSELHRAEGRRLDRLRLLDLLRASSPTASTRRRAASPARSRTGSRPSGAGRGRRTAASSTTAPRPTPTARRGPSARSYVWWDEDEQKWTGARRPGLRRRQAARLRPARRRGRPRTRLAATTRSSCRPTAAAGCSRPQGLVDGPLPTHYEPHESPFRNPLYDAATEPGAPASTGTDEPDGNPVDGAAGRRDVSRTCHDVPPDRAPHRRRDVALGAVPRRAAARDVLSRSAPSSRASAGSSTAAGRRSSTARAAIEARVLVTERIAPLHVDGRDGPPGRRCPTTGARAGSTTRRLRQRPVRARARPERAHPGGQGGDLRHPRRAGGRAGRALRSSSTSYRRRAGPTGSAREPGSGHGLRTATRGTRIGFFTDTTRLHRLQGLRGRVQGVEPRARGRPATAPGTRYDNTGGLGANTWRHVAFVEQRERAALDGDRAGRRRTSAG